MALMIEIKVVPSSGKRLCKLESGRLKCYLKSPPEKGKANKELVSLIAKSLKIPGSAVAMVTGATARRKRVEIDVDITFDTLLDALGIERQIKLF